MTLLVSHIDGDILTGSNWMAIRKESNPLYFGNETSGAILISTNTNITADWDVQSLTVSGGAVVTLTSGKRIRVADTLTFHGATSQILAGPNNGPGAAVTEATAGSAGRSGSGGSGGGFIGVFCTNLSGAGQIRSDGYSGTVGVASTGGGGTGIGGTNGSPILYYGSWISGNHTANPISPGGAGGAGQLGTTSQGGSGGGNGMNRGNGFVLANNDLCFFNSMCMDDVPGTGGGGGTGRADTAASACGGGGGGGGGGFIGIGGSGGLATNGASQASKGGNGGGGGGAGGCLLFNCRNFLGTPTTVLSAVGAPGVSGGAATGSGGGGGGSGGGGGGLILYWAPASMTANVSGGAAGAVPAVQQSAAGGAGQAGTSGRATYFGAFG